MMKRSVFFLSLLLLFLQVHGDVKEEKRCDEQVVNEHFLQCYRRNSANQSVEFARTFIDGTLLCQALNHSQAYHQCLQSIFEPDQICSKDIYPYTYEYSKIFWKLVISSCSVHQESHLDHCSPSPLNRHVIDRCQYSFDHRYPTQCHEFYRSVKCLDRHETDLIPVNFQSKCSRKKAFYYYYGDLAMRLQLAINVCEENPYN